MSTSLLEIYKYWVAYGRKEPIEDVIAQATSLICDGLLQQIITFTTCYPDVHIAHVSLYFYHIVLQI